MTSPALDNPPTDLLLAQRRDGLLWLTLNRADKANAMTVDMLERATAHIVAAGSDAEIQAVVLTGAGERQFCAGVDVREKPADGDMARQRERRSHAQAALQDAFLHTAKPIVVALNGMAIGAGAMLALLADACVAVESAELSLPEIDIGIPTFSGANILEVVGGRALSLDLIQSGRRMPATEALQRGLVRAAVPRGELEAKATTIAQALGAKDKHAFALNKRWINRTMIAALAEAREEHAKHRAEAAK
jgi:enoyl-CoA hydratase/carnithine racemase